MKNMTLRLDDERAATLELIARAENKTVTDTDRDRRAHRGAATRRGVHGSPQAAPRARARAVRAAGEVDVPLDRAESSFTERVLRQAGGTGEDPAEGAGPPGNIQPGTNTGS
jgi:hypothetical protein